MPFVPESKVWADRRSGRDPETAELRRALRPVAAPNDDRHDDPVGVRVRGRVRGVASDARLQVILSRSEIAGPRAEGQKLMKEAQTPAEKKAAKAKLDEARTAQEATKSNIQFWQELGGLPVGSSSPSSSV